jgi:hypothetical protein
MGPHFRLALLSTSFVLIALCPASNAAAQLDGDGVPHKPKLSFTATAISCSEPR